MPTNDMVLITFFIAGVVWGLARKGSLANALETDFRTWYLFAISIALFLALRMGVAFEWEFVNINAYIFLLSAYCLLLLGIMFNFRGLNFWMIFLLVGALLNFAVIFLNNGEMPYSEAALRIAGIAAERVRQSPIQGIASNSTMLAIFGGVIPVPLPVVPEVISMGTLFMAIGLLGTVKNLLLGVSYLPSEDDDEDEKFPKEEMQKFRSEPVPAIANGASASEATLTSQTTNRSSWLQKLASKKEEEKNTANWLSNLRSESTVEPSSKSVPGAAYEDEASAIQQSGMFAFIQDEPASEEFIIGSLENEDNAPILAEDPLVLSAAIPLDGDMPSNSENSSAPGFGEDDFVSLFEDDSEIAIGEDKFSDSIEDADDAYSPFVDITQQSFDDEDDFAFESKEPDELDTIASESRFSDQIFSGDTIPYRDSFDDEIFSTKEFKALRNIDFDSEEQEPLRQIPVADAASPNEELEALPSLTGELVESPVQIDDIEDFEIADINDGTQIEITEIDHGEDGDNLISTNFTIFEDTFDAEDVETIEIEETEPESGFFSTGDLGIEKPLLGDEGESEFEDAFDQTYEEHAIVAKGPQQLSVPSQKSAIDELLNELYNRVVSSDNASKEEAAANVDALKKLLESTRALESDRGYDKPSEEEYMPTHAVKKAHSAEDEPVSRQSGLDRYRGEDELFNTYFEDSGLLEDSEFFEDEFYEPKFDSANIAASSRFKTDQDEYYLPSKLTSQQDQTYGIQPSGDQADNLDSKLSEDGYDPSSPFIIVNGRIVENPNYKFKKTRADSAETHALEALKGDGSRNPSLRKAKPDFGRIETPPQYEAANRSEERLARIGNVNIDIFKKGSENNG